jgi:hypothetical protein
VQEKDKWWLIPGFRSKTPWKMLLAVYGYFMVVLLTTSVGTEGSIVFCVGCKICVLATCLISIAIETNYMGWGEKVLLINSKNILVKILARVILPVVVFFMVLLLMTIIGISLEEVGIE